MSSPRWGPWSRVGLLALPLLLTACEQESERTLASATLLGLEADQVLVGVEMNLTRAGVRNAVLVADTAFSYQEEGLLQLRNLVITFYGDTGLEEGVLTGREGEYEFETGDVKVNGEVEVTEALGSKRLVTERLRYVASVDSLYGDTAFVLYRPGLQSRGNSFVSDAQLENVQILNPSFVSEGDPTQAGSASPE
ncbi:MAG: LPS export ABC transporter periplasmic protein LptC [marine benthic group bacterium]|jgi:LPS export ABC transporter protein LptC|nr:LPS export ABC transporter periplasmic protein LptC [Candidatus Benthicola marisminoris]